MVGERNNKPNYERRRVLFTLGGAVVGALAGVALDIIGIHNGMKYDTGGLFGFPVLGAVTGGVIGSSVAN